MLLKVTPNPNWGENWNYMFKKKSYAKISFINSKEDSCKLNIFGYLLTLKT